MKNNTKIVDITQLLDNEYQLLIEKKEDSFPVSVFHPVIQDLLTELREKMNYSSEYSGAAILSACSTAIGSYFKVEVKRNAWYEKCNLYIILIGLAGSNKSHPLSFAFDPVHIRDKDSYKQYRLDLKAFQENQELSKEEKEKGMEKPVYVKSIISDFTPEALAMSHDHNPRGVTIVVDELKGWLNNFNRYNSGGEEQMYLSLWSGKSWLIDRKTQEPIRIDNPFVNVIGTIQPKLIHDFAKGGKSDNGFLDRMLFVWPKNDQPNLWNDKEVEIQLIKNYNIMISNLFDLIHSADHSDSSDPYDDQLSEILYFKEEAKEYLFKWQNKEEILLLDRDNNYEKAVFAKIQNYAIRFSMILHLQDIACEEQYSRYINLKTVQRAIVLAEYFRKVSLSIRETIENPDLLTELSSKQKDVLLALPKEFSSGVGIEIARSMGMPRSTFARFLNKKNFFKKIQHGNYRNLTK